jgi:hypothetical protein
MQVALVTATLLVITTNIVIGATFFHPLMSDSRRTRVNGSLTDQLDYTNRTFNCPFAIGSPAFITYNVVSSFNSFLTKKFFLNVCGFPIGSRSCCTNFELDEIIPRLITQYTTNMKLSCMESVTTAICAQCLPEAKQYAQFIPETGTFYFRICRDECAQIFENCKSHNGTYVDSTYENFCVKPTGNLKYPPEISIREHNYTFNGNFTGVPDPCWSGSTILGLSHLLIACIMMLIVLNY